MEDQILVIFGSNGDLAKRKIFPALLQLYIDKLLPKKFVVIGAGSKEKETEVFRTEVKENLRLFAVNNQKISSTRLDKFLECVFYKKVNNKTQEDFGGLKEFITDISQKTDIPQNIIFYFSIPPFLYETVAENLIKNGLNEENNGWKRIIVEKPFGYSYDSAVQLDNKLHQGFEEHQIYRIDHYLGKETVQNIMVIRFANGFFEPIWNSRYVDRVEITAAESIGVENRGGYYDTAGAMRDMIQNHLLQVLSIVAMEPPVVFDSDSIRNETVKVLQALRPVKSENINDYVIRGQYIKSERDGILQKSYREEKDVAPDSVTETFVALKLFVDNWRWGDVPFYIRTGKQLSERLTGVIIYLKPAPHQLFKHRCISESSNKIVLRIQPDGGIATNFGMKIPGAGYEVQNVNMAFHYSELSSVEIPEAYQRLLLDCMTGDSTLFARTDAVRASWKFVDPIIDAWKKDKNIPLYFYKCGTWGPEEANSLFGHERLMWNAPYSSFKTESKCSYEELKLF